MYGIGTTEMIAMLVIASIVLPRSYRRQFVDVLSRGCRALFGIEDADRDDAHGIVEDIGAAILVIALVTIVSASVVAMLPI